MVFHFLLKCINEKSTKTPPYSHSTCILKYLFLYYIHISFHQNILLPSQFSNNVRHTRKHTFHENDHENRSDITIL